MNNKIKFILTSLYIKRFKKCICGTYPDLMIEKNKVFKEGDKKDYLFVCCPNCGRYTDKEKMYIVLKRWNKEN